MDELVVKNRSILWDGKHQVELEPEIDVVYVWEKHDAFKGSLWTTDGYYSEGFGDTEKECAIDCWEWIYSFRKEEIENG